MSKAAKLPSPVEVLQKETEKDEAELIKLREDAQNAPDEPEELEEDSLPSDDAEESEPEEEPVQPAKEEETKAVEEQEPELSRELSQRGQERFRKLSEERRQALTELETLRKERENLLSMVQALQEQGLTRTQAEQAIETGYIDPRQYQQDVARNAMAIVNQTLAEREKQQTIIQSAERFQEDLKDVEEKHPELNEDHPEYDEELAGFVGELYQSKFEKDPKVRLPDIVGQVMKFRGKAAEEAQKKQVSKVAKQASQQAMTSSGGKTETSNLASRLAEADSDAELAELRKLLPIS